MMGAVRSAARRRVSGTSSATPVATFDWSGGAAVSTESVTRAGAVATRINSSGVRVAHAANTLRFDYDGQNPGTFLGILSDRIAASGFGSTIPVEVGDTREIVRDSSATGAFSVLVRNPGNTATLATLATSGSNTSAFLVWSGTAWVTA